MHLNTTLYNYKNSLNIIHLHSKNFQTIPFILGKILTPTSTA